MVEVSIFTVVVAYPGAPSVVVLAQKSAVSHILNAVPGISATRTEPLQASESNTAESAESSEKEPTTEASLALGDTEQIAPQLLPIWIGHSEAESIMLLLDEQPHSRPSTHDLLANTIGACGAKVERVVIDKVTGSTFFATVCLMKDGRKIQIDARPSDSIALALRTGAGIFVDEDVMNVASRQFKVKVSDGGELLYGSEDEMERFHSFIESVSPEDFV